MSAPARCASSSDEWVPGARAVFEKFDGYVPRDEKADWLAGGKRMHFDRIEWQIMPDAATASAALQNGEVDWWENADHRPGPAAAKEPQHRASTSPIRWATSAPSASTTCTRRSTTCGRAARC